MLWSGEVRAIDDLPWLFGTAKLKLAEPACLIAARLPADVDFSSLVGREVNATVAGAPRVLHVTEVEQEDLGSPLIFLRLG